MIDVSYTSLHAKQFQKHHTGETTDEVFFSVKLQKSNHSPYYYILQLKNEIIKQGARDAKLIKSHFALLISPVHLYKVNKQKQCCFFI